MKGISYYSEPVYRLDWLFTSRDADLLAQAIYMLEQAIETQEYADEWGDPQDGDRLYVTGFKWMLYEWCDRISAGEEPCVKPPRFLWLIRLWNRCRHVCWELRCRWAVTRK